MARKRSRGTKVTKISESGANRYARQAEKRMASFCKKTKA